MSARVRKRKEGEEEEGEEVEEEEKFSQKKACVQEQFQDETRGYALTALPQEVILRLLQYLPAEDLFSVRQVNRFLELLGSEVLLHSTTFIIPANAAAQMGFEEYMRVIERLGPMVRILRIVDNNTINIARYFPNLLHLTLDDAYQQTLSRDTVPRSLICIWIGDNYEPAWEVGAMPDTLLLFSVGSNPMFAVPQGYLPDSVGICFLGDVNPYQRLSWLPRGLRALYVESYSRLLGVGELPPDLQIFMWHGCNQQLEPELFPSTLDELTIRGTITGGLVPGRFPESLRELIIHGEVVGRFFEEGVLPSRLEVLHLGILQFNQQFTREILPQTLTELVLGTNYNQPFAPGVLPPTLQVLRLGRQYNHPLTRANLPGRLRVLTINSGDAQIMYLLGARYSHPYNDLPDSIEELYIELNQHDIETLPQSLRVLDIIIVRTRPNLGNIRFENPIRFDQFYVHHVAQTHGGLPW